VQRASGFSHCLSVAVWFLPVTDVGLSRVPAWAQQRGCVATPVGGPTSRWHLLS
jgi:hypothetical protein